MKTKTITLLASMLCPLSLLADDLTPGIVVRNADESTATIAISELRSIKFNDADMIVNMKDNSQQNFSIDGIMSITFDNIVTAITHLTEGASADGTVCITDISGRAIYRGNAANVPAQTSLPAGTYVITASGKSYKVIITKK